MPKSKRELLKSDEWAKFDQVTSDQLKGLPRPDIQKPVPPDALLVDLIPPDQFTLGKTPVIEVIRDRGYLTLGAQAPPTH